MTAKYTAYKKVESSYPDFDQLDGSHPWKEAMPEGFVSYRVRELNAGKVVYFNFHLAKEMGLIAPDHPHHLTADLEKKIIQTFSIQIINEYDELSKRRIDPRRIKAKTYMATRYLQLQHADKKGKTSGDGRGIWNGVVTHRGKVWDVSSRGTGVTCLAPGAVEANKPLRTGDTEFGYGCGQAELDELLGAAILAEAMHLQGIPTERVLCVIDLGKGVGIGVRAAPNLLRPAHLFLYLKQERYDELLASTEYFIDRQVQNKQWIFSKGPQRFEELADKICDSYADFTAKLDMDYIFAWLDWDGDNVLADAGIIDYGSVRQFGIRHDQYRYDDVERFSTNLNEQRNKARLIVQVFVQLADYLKTKKKKPLRQFASHPTVLKFNHIFARKRAERMLYRMGFSNQQRATILDQHLEVFRQFDKEFTYFEKAKISGPEEKVADGINHPALFNMRVLMRELPGHESFMKEEHFFTLILSSFAKEQDAQMSEKQRPHIRRFQKLYKELMTLVGGRPLNKTRKEIAERAVLLNSDNRITGNALIEIVEEIIQNQKKGLPSHQVQKLIDRLVFNHLGFPEVHLSRHYKNSLEKPAVRHDIYSRLLHIVQENRETI